jgi:hypothetical protein
MRFGLDHERLIGWGSLTPYCRPSATMVIAGIGVHGEQLIAHPERGLAPGFNLVRLRQGKTQLPQAMEGIRQQLTLQSER